MPTCGILFPICPIDSFSKSLVAVDHLASHGPYSEADAARLIREVASALAYLHGLHVVHGDLKPENRMCNA